MSSKLRTLAVAAAVLVAYGTGCSSSDATSGDTESVTSEPTEVESTENGDAAAGVDVDGVLAQINSLDPEGVLAPFEDCLRTAIEEDPTFWTEVWVDPAQVEPSSPQLQSNAQFVQQTLEKKCGQTVSIKLGPQWFELG